MAAKTNSKDLRRLMKEKLNSSKKKINSPLAKKYNNAGQLFCVLCNTILKSDLLWDAHIRGAKHKENLIVLKSGRPKTSANPAKHHPVQKPRHEIVTFTETGRTTVESLNKKRKEEISSLSSETPEPKKLRTFSQPVKSSVPSDFFDKDLSNSADDQDKIPDNEMDTSASVPSASGLPTDFYDCPSTDTRESESIQSSKDCGGKRRQNLTVRCSEKLHGFSKYGRSLRKESNKSEAIPEGFFDDPKLDAKVRNVEYKDPAEEEWEKFQKALSTENQVSEAIIYEEEEESRIDRALDEISEQRLYYLRADVLRDKQSTFKKNRDENRDQCKRLEMKDESESDSDDIENLFNWRAKKAL